MNKSQIIKSNNVNKSVTKIILLILISFFIIFLFNLNSQDVLARSQPWITINNNQYNTKVRKVTLQLWAPEDVIKMKISNTSDFSQIGWEPFVKARTWYLPYGAGQKRVYVKYLSSDQSESSVYSDLINMYPPAKMTLKLDVADGVQEVFSRVVTLNIKYSEGTEEMAFSNSEDFSGAKWQPAQTTKTWTLTRGEGEKTVYMRARDARENIEIISDKVTLIQPSSEIDVGTVVRSQDSGLYYLGEDGKIHPYLGLHVFHSWYKDFNDVLVISNNRLISHQVGAPVCIKPGTWLVSIKGTNEIYAVEPGCQLWKIRSEVEATLLYGEAWQNRVLTISAAESSIYSFVDRSSPEKDRDNDGVSYDQEKLHGTSDSSSDTDRDGVSDFEEIHFWFSDPTKRDSDGDSYTDGDEIRGGFSPSGINKINSIPRGYEYPVAMFDGNHLFRVSNSRSISAREYHYSYDANKPYIIANNNLIEL